ncbi:hypothetical protein M758_10G055600 [Ceratodon purpureus]|nr:hypothetical protein M758_10G055600 [Ceratodon purpureus]
MASITVNGTCSLPLSSSVVRHAEHIDLDEEVHEDIVDLKEEEQEDIISKLVVMLLSISWTPAAALRTIVELNIPKILATHASAPTHSMTAEELLERAPGASKPNARNLERMMRLLTCKNIFTEEVENVSEGGLLKVIRRYALTPLSRVLVPDHATGTMANFVKFTTMSPVFCKAMEHLSESILSGGSAFESAFGTNAFDYMTTHPDQLHCFQAAMTDHTNQMLPIFLAKYQGFKGVKKLMDVGGGDGTTLSRILARHPHIQGVNFDLPEVVARAPCHPGVEHMVGDMFQSIPFGCDAIFMKTILHDWNDEDCLKILRNCYSALPVGGKVIIVDALVPVETSTNSEDYENVGTFMSDFCMQAHCPDGRERQEHEFQYLVKAAGFSNFQVVVQLDYMFVMEGVKQ